MGFGYCIMYITPLKSELGNACVLFSGTLHAKYLKPNFPFVHNKETSMKNDIY